MYGIGEPGEAAIFRKRKLVLTYASQIDDEAGALIANHAARHNGAERLWANQRWLDALLLTDTTYLSIFLTTRRTVSVTTPYTTSVAISLVRSRRV